jgi:hypothetical protein
MPFAARPWMPRFSAFANICLNCRPHSPDVFVADHHAARGQDQFDVAQAA